MRLVTGSARQPAASAGSLCFRAQAVAKFEPDLEEVGLEPVNHCGVYHACRPIGKNKSGHSKLT